MQISLKLIVAGSWLMLGTSLAAQPGDAQSTTATRPMGQWLTLPATPTLPPPDRTARVRVNGIKLWYGEYGVAQSGIPVLLLHGGLASTNYFGSLIPALTGRGYRVIALDSRGQGRSTRTAEPFSYQLLASDILALLDTLKLAKVDIVGWSDGGIIGLEIAMRHPERINRLFTFGANVNPSGTVENVDKNPVFAKYLLRTRQEYRHLSATPGQYDALVAQIEAMWAHDPHYTSEQLAKISVPVTVADGRFDEAIRIDHTFFMASAIPGANAVILPNVSHFAMLQNPAEFADAVIAFLRYR